MGTAEHLLFIPYLQLMRVLSNAHPFIFVYLHLDCISFSLVFWPCLPIDSISQCVCFIQCQLMCFFFQPVKFLSHLCLFYLHCYSAILRGRLDCYMHMSLYSTQYNIYSSYNRLIWNSLFKVNSWHAFITRAEAGLSWSRQQRASALVRLGILFRRLQKLNIKPKLFCIKLTGYIKCRCKAMQKSDRPVMLSPTF